MTTTPPSPMTRFAYRPDIDGLRAIAVLAVVAFHLGFSRLEGGFLGVDVFFVISGYLITSIIAPKMAVGTFSFRDFYLKRIRRLIPPALVTAAFTFLASAFILDPTDLIAMAKSAIAAVFSVSNILFFTEAGYWDAQSELKPLLHTWSLGVEEQFYIFWPLLVFMFWKLSPKRNLAWAFAAVTIIGLIVSEWMLRANPSAAFYLLPARVFEFAIGASFAFIGKSAAWSKIGTSGLRALLGWGSLLVLLATMWFYKGETPFPGLNGFLPCLATAMLLLSGVGAKATPGLGFFLGHPIMSWIGRISYSLYLVHWPVVSLMRYKVGLELHLHHQIIAVALMAVLTLALYYGIEQRISSRAGQGGKDKVAPTKPKRDGHFAIGTGLTALAVSAIFAHAALTSGWTWRFSELSYTPEKIATEKGRRFSELGQACPILNFPDGKNCNPQAKLNILVFGNSHEPDGFNFIKAAYGDDPLVQLIRFEEVNRCDLKLEGDKIIAKGNGRTCQERLANVLDPEFIKQFQFILYSSNRPFQANKDVSLAMISTMKSANPDLKLITMGGYINTRAECSRLINETGRTNSCVETGNVTTLPGDDKTADLYPAFMKVTDYYLDKGTLLCTGEQPESCESETPGRVPFSYDQHHLSLEFAQYAGEKFAAENPTLLRDLAGLPPR